MAKTEYNWDLIMANVLFGANFSFYVSLTRYYMDFRQIFMCQILAGSLFFIPFAIFSRRSYRITLRDFGNLLLVSLLVVYGWQYMLLWGASRTSPIDASTIATLGPAFTLITAIVVHHRRVIWADIGGIALALAGGAVLIFDRGAGLFSGGEGYGNLLVLAAVVAIAVNTVLIKPQLRKLGVAVVVGWYYIIGLAATAPFFWRYIAHTDFLRLTFLPRMELLYIMVFGTVLPMFLLYRGTAKLTSVHTALYRYIQPVAAASLALLRRQESIDRANIVAACVIFAGIVLTMIGFYRAKENHQEKKL